MGSGFKMADPSPVRKERLLLLSTDHLTEDTMDWLAEKEQRGSHPLHARGDHGYFIRVASSIWNPPDLPGDFVAMLQFAKDRNVEWILLDQDEEHIKGLPTYGN